MTLIIGHASEDIGFLVGDTLLSFQNQHHDQKKPINGQAHALKIRILNPDTAIAFAGDVEVALELIQHLQSELSAERGLDVCGHLSESYKDKGSPECDFLILQLTQNGPKLNLIKEGKFTNCQQAYIGDQDEYSRLQELRKLHPYSPPTTQHIQQSDGSFVTLPLTMSTGELDFESISDAMIRLTSQWNSKSTVGSISSGVTRICNARISGKLEYLQSHVASVSPFEGSSGYSWYASNTATRGMAIYYPLGKVGYLFIDGDTEHSRTEYAETATHFIETAKKKYGLKLK